MRAAVGTKWKIRPLRSSGRLSGSGGYLVTFRSWAGHGRCSPSQDCGAATSHTPGICTYDRRKSARKCLFRAGSPPLRILLGHCRCLERWCGGASVSQEPRYAQAGKDLGKYALYGNLWGSQSLKLSTKPGSSTIKAGHPSRVHGKPADGASGARGTGSAASSRRPPAPRACRAVGRLPAIRRDTRRPAEQAGRPLRRTTGARRAVTITSNLAAPGTQSVEGHSTYLVGEELSLRDGSRILAHGGTVPLDHRVDQPE